MVALQVAAVDASNRYRSPRNPERKIRRSTELIVLHTTEAPARGSLTKLSERGECHFCVTEEGEIYRIVDRDREAFHAGRSMWNGKENVDKFSIGIECVGYHDKAMPLIQLYAIRDLVRELKGMYHLSDDKVICHGHVAYGAPNKWHRVRHRGRKQCGMLFAMPSVRRILELKTRPAYDPDTRAKRLVSADPYLAKVLYGNVDTFRGTYSGAAVATRKSTMEPAATATDKILTWLKAKGEEDRPAAPRAEIKAAPPPVSQPTRATVAAHPPSTASRTFKSLPRSESELRAAGYSPVGTVTRGRTASSIAGGKWNDSATYYTIRNKVIPGNMIDSKHIEVGMRIWMRR